MDYEKKYKKIVGKIKKAYLHALTDSTKAVLEEIYPELAESEDEKVRKALIKLFEIENLKRYVLVDGIDIEDVLGWLERQGEHANFRNKIQVGDKVTRNENGVLVNLSQLKRVAKPSKKQGEKHPDPYNGISFEYNGHIWGMCARDGGVEILMDGNITSRVFPDKNNIIEQKPTDSYCQENCKGFQETGKCFADGECKAKRESDQKPEENKGNIGGISANWSEKDEAVLDALIRRLKGEDIHVSLHLAVECLESLKGRVQPKQEWNEEDEHRIKDTIYFLDTAKKHYASTEELDACIDWLKSLRPQNTYNPYKAVVESIAEMCKHYDKASHSGLRDFYDNVKVKCKDAQEYDKMFPQAQWKPSDEQMGCLSDAIEYYNSSGYPAPKLKELLDDLKKIKEGNV